MPPTGIKRRIGRGLESRESSTMTKYMTYGKEFASWRKEMLLNSETERRSHHSYEKWVLVSLVNELSPQFLT
jgi:hypothetical protein